MDKLITLTFGQSRTSFRDVIGSANTNSQSNTYNSVAASGGDGSNPAAELCRDCGKFPPLPITSGSIGDTLLLADCHESACASLCPSGFDIGDNSTWPGTYVGTPSGCLSGYPPYKTFCSDLLGKRLCGFTAGETYNFCMDIIVHSFYAHYKVTVECYTGGLRGSGGTLSTTLTIFDIGPHLGTYATQGCGPLVTACGTFTVPAGTTDAWFRWGSTYGCWLYAAADYCVNVPETGDCWQEHE